METIGHVLDRNPLPVTTNPPKSTTSECSPDEFTGLETETYREWTDKNGKSLGYGVNPRCLKCRGIGKVYFGDELCICDAPGCLGETFAAWRGGTTAMASRGVSKPQQTFETIKPSTGIKPMVDALREMAEDRASFRFLLIYGGTGNGKTHCCNALAARLVQRGKPVKLWAVADLFARLRKSVGTNTLEDEIEILKGERFLILDDWAPEYASKFEIARMEEVVDYRYRQGLYTVLTTNRPLPELPDRIVSRFSEHPIGKRVQNSARDYRLKGGER